MLRRMSASSHRPSWAVASASARFVGLHGGSSKCMTAKEAAALVRNGDTITVSGFVAQGVPEGVLRALAERYESVKAPANLTLCFTGGPGDWANKGLNHLAKPGMLKKTIGSHYGQTPRIAEMVQRNEIEAYNVPMGTICRMIRACASGRKGYATTVGLDTMADPACGGGRLNDKTKSDLAKRITSPDGSGDVELFYPPIAPNVAIIRGTTADLDGNISFEQESLYCDCLNMAMATRSNGGIVICQVKRLADRGTINPRMVRVPGALVDVVVVAEPEDHKMSFFTDYNPAWSGELRVPMSQSPMEFDERKIIARRGALNLLPGQVVNLGIGMPEGVALVAGEEGILDQVSLTTEPGTHGGIGASGHDFGPAINYSGLLEMNQQFDFYNGGGLDICFLGMAEVTQQGDVNVTRVGPKLTGPGGFIDISQSTQRVNLVGSFTAGGLEVAVEDGKLKIVKEGRVKKFVNKIPEVTFSGKRALINGQVVNYITERCVFTLSKEGLVLAEVAPGVDIERDILRLMEFKPLIPVEPRLMNPLIFRPGKMGLADSLQRIDMETRLFYVAESNTLFVDLAAVHLHNKSDIGTIIDGVRSFVEARLGGKQVNAEINYFGFVCAPDLRADYDEACAALEAKCYATVRRHYGRTFTHLKSAAPRMPVPDSVDLEAAIKYVQKHNLRLSRETFQTRFNEAAKGATTLNREQFANLLASLPTQAQMRLYVREDEMSKECM